MGLKDLLASAGKNFIKEDVLPSAIKWGLIGGGALGAVEKARGGSFFEGASRGAVLGAIGGGAYGGYSQSLKSLKVAKDAAKASAKVASGGAL